MGPDDAPKCQAQALHIGAILSASADGRFFGLVPKSTLGPNGMNLEASIDSLMRTLRDDELHWLIAEVEQMAFGDDTAAHDAAKREALMAADQGGEVTGSQERG
jgi:hypothetical protein